MEKYKTTPIKHAAVMWAGVLTFFVVYPTNEVVLQILLLGLALLLYAAAMFAVVPLIEHYQSQDKKLGNIMGMYAGSVTLFAAAYAVAAVTGPKGQFVCGIINSCTQDPISVSVFDKEKRDLVVELVFNSFYVSVTNLVTLGPTGIELRSWARFIVVCQVIYTFFLTGVALSGAMSSELLRDIKKEIAIHVGRLKRADVRIVDYWRLPFLSRVQLAWKVLRGRQ